MTLQLTLATPVTVTPWRDRAACAGHPTGWWFADPGTLEAGTAEAICASCAVRNECDADADRHGDGGFRAWRTRNPAPILCDGCRQPLGVVELAAGDLHCGPTCAEAGQETEWQRKGHGRISTYNGGCRCSDCRGAARDSRRRSRARLNTTSDVGPAYGAGPRTEGEQR